MKSVKLPNKFNHTNLDVLKQFITETGKIIPARVSGVNAAQQRKITQSIKVASFLALLPYTDQHK